MDILSILLATALFLASLALIPLFESLRKQQS
jgi:hypothetical protein